MKFFGVFAAVLFLLCGSAGDAKAASQDFQSWLQELRQDAVKYGISQGLVAAALPDTLSPNETILRLDRKQPEHTITFAQYKKNVITPQRIAEGRRHLAEQKDLLNRISQEYRVEPQYIVALWGIETSFGKNIGGFETIPALATLAYDGRRGVFFRQELFKALKIIDEGNIALHEMKGSWAGAMGQCQFMPSSFEKFAQDYNKDGKKDIWRTKADVFASAAQYLSVSGWKIGQPWGHLVKLPKNFDQKMIGVKIQKPLQFWKDAGVEIPPALNTQELVSVIQPGGEGYKAYIVYGNYRIIMKWNTSTYFATSVALLADQLKS